MSEKDEDLQVEALIPHGIELLWHCSGAFLYFAHLNGDVRIRRATLVLGDESLSANHCATNRIALASSNGPSLAPLSLPSAHRRKGADDKRSKRVKRT